MKTIKRLLASVLVLATVLTLTLSFNITNTNAEIQVTYDYHYITEDKLMAIPKVFQVRTTITKFKSSLNAPTFKNATDMFIDDDDNIYILDVGAGNEEGRVVKMDIWGNVKLEVATITCRECAQEEKKCRHTSVEYMKAPEGIFVFDEVTGDPRADQHIYIADTKNKRVVHLDAEGYFVEEFVKPDIPALSDIETFDVNKVYIDKQGTIYLTLASYFQGFMTFGPDGEYRGNTGMTWTVSSVTEIISGWFSKQDDEFQRKKLTAPPYSNFMMSDDGWIYATVDGADTKQITKINTSGVNVYKDQKFGAEYYEITDPTTYAFTEYKSNFVDVTVDDYGIIYALDEKLGNIFMYDQDGNNLAYFGSLGSYRGRFKQPVAIGILNDSSIVVLDSKKGEVTVFEPTEFCTLMKEGTYLYYDAQYVESRAIWNRLLELDGNYIFAHKALGKAFFKEKNYDAAMAEYKLAQDMEGYSLSFEKKKADLTDKYFFLIVLIIAVALVVVVIAYRAIKKYIDKLHVKITTWGGDD